MCEELKHRKIHITDWINFLKTLHKSENNSQNELFLTKHKMCLTLTYSTTYPFSKLSTKLQSLASPYRRTEVACCSSENKPWAGPKQNVAPKRWNLAQQHTNHKPSEKDTFKILHLHFCKLPGEIPQGSVQGHMLFSEGYLCGYRQNKFLVDGVRKGSCGCF